MLVLVDIFSNFCPEKIAKVLITERTLYFKYIVFALLLMRLVLFWMRLVLRLMRMFFDLLTLIEKHFLDGLYFHSFFESLFFLNAVKRLQEIFVNLNVVSDELRLRADDGYHCDDEDEEEEEGNADAGGEGV